MGVVSLQTHMKGLRMDGISIRYTIVICLHNSLEFLDEQLTRIITQNVDLSSIEVLIIDNASCEEISFQIRKMVSNCKALTIRYIYESQIGAQYARNRGVMESQGEFLLYLDDDALPCAGWLKGMLECFIEDGNRMIQGRITLSYRKERPRWITPHLEMLLSKVDFGLERTAHNPHYILANMAIPKCAFEMVGGWDLSIGRKGDILLSGEDGELAMRIADTGKFSCFYCGDATVEHVVRNNRYEKGFHLNRSYWQGVTAGFLMRAHPHTRKYSVGIITQVKIGCGSLLLWPVLLLCRDIRAFTYKCRALSMVGFFYGLLFFRGLPRRY